MAMAPSRKSTRPASLPAFVPRVAVGVAVALVAAIVAAFRFRRQRAKAVLLDGDTAAASPRLPEVCSKSQLGDWAVEGALGRSETLPVEAGEEEVCEEDGEVAFGENAGMGKRNGFQEGLSAAHLDGEEASFNAGVQQCCLGEGKMDAEICPQASESTIDSEKSRSAVRIEENTIGATQMEFETVAEREFSEVREGLPDAKTKPLATVNPPEHGIICQTGPTSNNTRSLSDRELDDCSADAKEEEETGATERACQHSELKTEHVGLPANLAERTFSTGTAVLFPEEACQLFTVLGESHNLLDVELQEPGFDSGKGNSRSSSESQCSQISDTASLIASPLTVNLTRTPPPEEDEEVNSQIPKAILESPSGMEGEKVDLCVNEAFSEQAGSKLELCETSQFGKREDPVQFARPVVMQQILNPPAFMTIWEPVTFQGRVFLSVKNVISLLLIGILSIILCYMWGGWKHLFPS